MTLLKKSLLSTCLILGSVLFFSNCKKDDAEGSVTFEITDAPIDNTNIKGSFVTVTAVKVDGETISSSNGKQTIDLMAYQNGDTRVLGLADLEAGTYSNVSLVLDYAADANGNTPGCYVLTNDNVKHNLQSSSATTGEITLSNGNFTVAENATTTFVMDFDIRKAIKQQDNPQADDEYDFVTDAELRSSIRLVDKEASAKVKGKVSDSFGMAGDRIVVYAYSKGSFNQNTETAGQGSSNIAFKNAVTSCIVKADGSYDLSFLPEGEYELHFVSYEETGNDGSLEANGMIQVTSLLSLDILGLQLNSSAALTLDVTVTGITPL
jgi:Domain of unknown function (DUF4382)